MIHIYDIYIYVYHIKHIIYVICIYILHFIYLLERYYGKPNNKPSPDFPEIGAYEPSKVGDKTLTNSDGVLTEPPLMNENC